jgi:hypothetical protein
MVIVLLIGSWLKFEVSVVAYAQSHVQMYGLEMFDPKGSIPAYLVKT